MFAIERGNANPTPVDINSLSALVAAPWRSKDRAMELLVGFVGGHPVHSERSSTWYTSPPPRSPKAKTRKNLKSSLRL
jgi:hypothetical protein